jgi:membrane-bound metal-dependent hydrolase YbcI (DUF457 family)
MRAESHRVLGAATGVTLSHLAGQNLGQVIVGGALAAVTAGGFLSPDCDQFKAWKRWHAPLWRAFARLLMLFMPWWWTKQYQHGNPVQHRGFTHWWGVPALWSVALLAGQAVRPGVGWWVAWMLVAGWSSHILGDAVHGRQVHGQDGNGVPLAPWWHHVGVDVRGRSLKSSGWTERFVTVPVVAVAAVWQVVVVAASLR